MRSTNWERVKAHAERGKEELLRSTPLTWEEAKEQAERLKEDSRKSVK